jgi:hypothetical protein
VARVAGLDTLPTPSAASQHPWTRGPLRSDADKTEVRFVLRDDLFRRGTITIEGVGQTYEARLRIRRPANN